MNKLLPFEKYPSSLNSWKDSGKKLWFLGDPSLMNLKMISIIGTRNPEFEEARRTEIISRLVLAQGFCIVSGMAKGVDTIAHKTALVTSGKTIAVMGTAIEDCYPKENLDLKNDIEKSGLVLSQFKPGSPVNKFNFPNRNELMAELSLASIVTAAGPQSGTRHQIIKAVRLQRKIAFSKTLVDKNYEWVKEFLSYENCFVIADNNSFENWLKNLVQEDHSLINSTQMKLI